MPLRPATTDDIPSLLDLEEACFRTDQLGRRNFRHLLTRGHAVTLVDTDGAGVVRGYIMGLYTKGAPRIRLYSLAVGPAYRGQGIAKSLLLAAEAAALARGLMVSRLEVRADDPVARGLYERLGYRQFGTYPGYYEDGMDAVRMDKPLRALDAPPG